MFDFIAPIRLTDADIPMLKAWFADQMKRGQPLFLLPNMAHAAEAKGFEEGVHFLRQEMIPVTYNRVRK